jgi:hyperosmotically inducible protein
MTTRRTFLAALAAVSLMSCAETKTRESTGQYLDDSAITSKVKTALIRDPMVGGFNIEVETYKGTVQLSGFVDTESERRQAGTLAAEVDGVRSVKNDIRVKR